MGYACPVCGHPQSDARHLANHLAFTALARGGDHEAWLDDRVPEWESLDETALGDRVVDHADPVEFPQVFEDTTPGESADEHSHDATAHEHGRDHAGDGHDHAGEGHAHTRAGDGTRDPRIDAARRAAEGAVTDDAADVLAEARELTRKRRENAARADEEGETDEGETDDGVTDDMRKADGSADDTGTADGSADESETE